MGKKRRRPAKRASPEPQSPPPRAFRAPSWWPWLVVVAGAAATLGLVWPAMEIPFTQDDFTFLSQVVAGGSGESFGLFSRPLSRLAWFGALYALAGDSPLVFHLAGFALHAGAMALLCSCARAVTGSAAAALAATLLFACNGAYLTLFAWVSCCQELLMAVFVLAAWRLAMVWAAEGRWPWLLAAAGCFALSLLSKETGLLLPVVLGAHGLLLMEPGPKRRRMAWAAAATGAVTLLFAASLALQGLDEESGRYTMAASAVPVNLTTYFFWVRIFWTVIGRGEGQLVDVAPLELLLPTLMLAAGWLAGRWRGAVFGVFWLLVFLAPVLPLETQVYRYYLYLPLAGWWLGVAWVAVSAAERLVRPGPALTIGRVAVVGLACVHLAISGGSIRQKILDQRRMPDIGLLRRGFIARNFQRSAASALAPLTGPVTLSLESPDRTRNYQDRQVAAALAYGHAVQYFFPEATWELHFHAFAGDDAPWPPAVEGGSHLLGAYLPNGQLQSLQRVTLP